MLQTVQKLFYRYYLNQRLKEHSAKHQMVNFNQAKSIGILFDAGKDENIVWIRRYADELEKQKKTVSLLGFVNTNHANEQTAYPCFSRKQTNWYLQPAHHVPNEFIEKKFDILLNAFITESATLEYIATFSNAKFRVGPFFENKLYCADFMINLKESDNLADFMKNAIHYLKLMQV